MSVLQKIPLGSLLLHVCDAAPSHSATDGDLAVYAGAYYGRVSGSWVAVGSGSGGAVSSVFGRTGTVVAASNDYSFAQVSGSAAIGQLPTGTTSSTVALGNHNHTGVYAPATHTHAESDITGLATDLAGKAPTVHTHAESDVTNLVSDLASKAATVHTHAASDVTSGTFATARIPHVGKRSAANVALSASTTVNVTDLDLTVASGDVWVLDYILPVTVSAGTVGLKPIFTLPASSTGTMDVSGTTTAVTAYSYTHSTTPTTAAAVAFMTALFTGYVYVRAVLTMGAAGTCRIGVTTGTSAAGNLLAGCSVMGFKI